MRPILPNKTEFVPHAPENEHEIFSGMRTYPDNVKVYHPHGTIDATSVFWHNKLHPNALNFACMLIPKPLNGLSCSSVSTPIFKNWLGSLTTTA